MPEDFLPGLLETLELRMIKPGKANPLTGLLTSPETLGAGSEIGYTDEQGQFQVTNPEARKVFFDRFFEGSKVVDEQGNPLVVYHGGTSDPKNWPTARRFQNLQSYNKEQYDSDTGGMFFSPRLTTAQIYAGDRGHGIKYDPKIDDYAPYVDYQKGGNIAPVYLSIKNPLYLDSSITKGRKFKEGLINKMAKRRGLDGIIFTRDGKPQDYEVFYPQQIKSIFNRGTFDPKDPDILSMNQTQKGLIYG